MFSALAGCLTQDGAGVGEGEEALDSDSEPGGEAIVLPPGGLVDTQPSSGWTEGSFDVSGDGAAVYDLPLWVPDGRRGLQPGLSLHYDSRSGNSLVGVGWSLQGLSAIAPCPRTFAQDSERRTVTFTASDAYCLDGSRLRPVDAGTPERQEFRTERDPFARIVAHRASAQSVPSSFEVWTRNGRILTYGGTDNAKLRARRLVGIRPEDPAFAMSQDPVTASWALSRIADRNGNQITVAYSSFESLSMAGVGMFPSRIDYGPDRSVVFQYEFRPDAIDQFRAGGVQGGIHAWLPVRLKTIQMLGGTQKLREYRLAYDDTQSITGRSRLTGVTECDEAGICLLPVQFEWSSGSREFDVIDTDVRDAGSFPLSGYTYLTGDVNGDGADDLVYGDQNNEWRIRLNDLAGHFGAAYAAGIPRAFDRFQQPRVRPVDYDRDGRLDLMVEINAGTAVDPAATRFALYRAVDGTYQAHTPELDEMRTGEVGDALGVYQGYFASLTGNGLADYLAPRFDVGSRLRWRYVAHSSLDTSVRVTDVYTEYADDRIQPIRAIDTDGDGLTEVLVADPVNQRYEKIQYVGEAQGPERSLAKSTQNLNLPFARLPENGDPANLHFADVNGDGLEDAIYPFSGLSVQLSSGAGFSHLIAGPSDYVAPETRTDSEHRGVRILDFDNDGTDDVLVFHPGRPDSPGDFTKGIQLYTWRGNRFVRRRLSDDPDGTGPAMPASFNRDGVQLLDFDRDGVTDISYVVPPEGTTQNFLRVLKRRGGVPDL
jgi:hypothetical protein